MTAGSISVPQIIPLRLPRGCRKHVIDSCTDIELRSESKNSIIFYTLNGNKPDPFQSFGKKFTFKYEKPFRVVKGKVTVKALAMSTDGSRQSLVVTRTFMVHETTEQSNLPSEAAQDGASFLHDTSDDTDLSLSQRFRQKLRTSSRESLVLNLTQSSTEPLQKVVPCVSPSSTSHSLSLLTPRVNSAPSLRSQSAPPPQWIGTHTDARPDMIVCVYCSHPRSSDPSRKYCTECGSILPPLPSPGPPPPTRLAVCPGCRAELPLGAMHCIVCNESVPQPQPMPSIKSQHGTTSPSTEIADQQISCLECGTVNVLPHTECVTCSGPLSAAVSPPALVEPRQANTPQHKPTVMEPITGSSYMICGNCGRVNVSDARFCDWCGSKPEGSDVLLACQSCSVPNEWQARFCCQCGSIMKCPLRPDVELGVTMQMPRGAKVNKNKWVPVTDIVTHKADKSVCTEPEAKHCSTQTQGIFYHSATTIAGKKHVEAWKRAVKATSRDRVVNLTTFSAGKGMWRTQLDHICSHLRAHTLSSSKFQDVIGYLELGKIVDASVKDDRSGQLQLRVLFELKGYSGEDSLPGYRPNSVARRKSSASMSILRRRSSGSVRSSSGIIRSSSSSSLIKVEDHLLAAELRQDGKGRPNIVASLIEQGATVNSTSGGLSMLSMAVSNAHSDAVSTLLEKGASLNGQAKRTGHTALHEAVLKGPSHENIIRHLLSAGADPSIKNKEGLTPAEMASKLGYTVLVNLFAEKLGSQMLSKWYR